jgi:hypothetical protein
MGNPEAIGSGAFLYLEDNEDYFRVIEMDEELTNLKIEVTQKHADLNKAIMDLRRKNGIHPSAELHLAQGFAIPVRPEDVPKPSDGAVKEAQAKENKNGVAK